MSARASQRPPSMPPKAAPFGAGMKSLALAVPETERTNDYYRGRVPEVVKALEEKAAQFAASPPPSAGPSPSAFDDAMAPYLADPFRGTLKRRILEPGKKALDLELAAAE